MRTIIIFISLLLNICFIYKHFNPPYDTLNPLEIYTQNDIYTIYGLTVYKESQEKPIVFRTESDRNEFIAELTSNN